MTFLHNYGLQFAVFAEPLLQFLFDLIGGDLLKWLSYIDFEIGHEDLVRFELLFRLGRSSWGLVR